MTFAEFALNTITNLSSKAKRILAIDIDKTTQPAIVTLCEIASGNRDGEVEANLISLARSDAHEYKIRAQSVLTAFSATGVDIPHDLRTDLIEIQKLDFIPGGWSTLTDAELTEQTIENLTEEEESW